MKIILEMHLVQIVTHTSNFSNLYFFGGQNKYFALKNKEEQGSRKEQGSSLLEVFTYRLLHISTTHL